MKRISEMIKFSINLFLFSVFPVFFLGISAQAADPELKPIFTGTDLKGWEQPKLAECWIVTD